MEGTVAMSTLAAEEMFWNREAGGRGEAGGGWALKAAAVGSTDWPAGPLAVFGD